MTDHEAMDRGGTARGDAGAEAPAGRAGEGDDGGSGGSGSTLRKWTFRIVPVVLLAAAAAYLGPKLLYSRSHESTEDAYVGSTIVPVIPQVGGKVTRVYVANHDRVHEGQPLVEIDSTDYRNAVATKRSALASARSEKEATRASLREQRQALEAARADLEAAAVQESVAASDRDRYEKLLEAGSISQSRFDHEQSAWKVARARARSARARMQRVEATIERLEAKLRLEDDRIDQARTALAHARDQLGRTTITAPADGVLAKKDVNVGQVVQPGAPLMKLVEQDSVFVDANFKETQLHDIRVGQPVEVEIDAYPEVTFHGHVASFQPGTGATFSLLPPENATGNFVKVVRRVPVRILIDSGNDAAHPLWPGLSAVPHVVTDGSGGEGSG